MFPANEAVEIYEKATYVEPIDWSSVEEAKKNFQSDPELHKIIGNFVNDQIEFASMGSVTDCSFSFRNYVHTDTYSVQRFPDQVYVAPGCFSGFDFDPPASKVLYAYDADSKYCGNYTREIEELSSYKAYKQTCESTDPDGFSRYDIGRILYNLIKDMLRDYEEKAGYVYYNREHGYGQSRIVLCWNSHAVAEAKAEAAARARSPRALLKRLFSIGKEDKRVSATDDWNDMIPASQAFSLACDEEAKHQKKVDIYNAAIEKFVSDKELGDIIENFLDEHIKLSAEQGNRAITIAYEDWTHTDQMSVQRFPDEHHEAPGIFCSHCEGWADYNTTNDMILFSYDPQAKHGATEQIRALGSLQKCIDSAKRELDIEVGTERISGWVTRAVKRVINSKYKQEYKVRHEGRCSYRPGYIEISWMHRF